MKRNVAFSLVLPLLLVIRSSQAAIFTPPVEVRTVDHFYTFTGDPEFPNYGGEIFRFDAASISADLDADTQIAYTLRAPEGFNFRLGPGSGYFYADLEFGNSSAATAPAAIRLDLENATGPTPGFGEATLVFIPNEIRTFSSSAGEANNYLKFGGACPIFSGPLEFTGMVFTLTYEPRSLGLGPQTFAYLGGGVNTLFFSTSDSDPGPLIQMVPVPEPATSALLGGIALVIFGAIHRVCGHKPQNR